MPCIGPQQFGGAPAQQSRCPLRALLDALRLKIMPPPPAQSQMELLQRTGWRVRLDLAADVLPCHALLFCPAVVGSDQLQLGLPPALALPPAVAAMQEWAPTMRRLCAVMREKVRFRAACLLAAPLACVCPHSAGSGCRSMR